MTQVEIEAFLTSVEDGTAQALGGRDPIKRIQRWGLRYVRGPNLTSLMACRLIEMVGLSVYGLKAEWPNFFRFVVSILMFLAARLVFRVYHNNKRAPAAAPKEASTSESITGPDVTQSAVADQAGAVETKKTQ